MEILLSKPFISLEILLCLICIKKHFYLCYVITRKHLWRYLLDEGCTSASLKSCTFLSFLFDSFYFFPVNLLFVQNHLAEVIVVKRLIRKRNGGGS